MTNDLSEILKEVDIIAFFEAYGFEPIRGGYCDCCKDGYYKLVCPLHDDKNPSFHIHPDTASWYCWGCGHGGTAVDFVMQYEDIDLKEAVKRFRKKGGNRFATIRRRLENAGNRKNSEEKAQQTRWINLGMLARDFVPVEEQDELMYYLDKAFYKGMLDIQMYEKIKKKIFTLGGNKNGRPIRETNRNQQASAGVV